jgi:hypothetical protein
MKIMSRFSLVMIAGLVFALLSMACAGEAGTNGTNGTDGTNGTNGVAGALGVAGAAGAAGADGATGPAGAQVVAGISFGDNTYNLEGGTGKKVSSPITITGWGFNPNENVVITAKTNARTEIILSADANAYGAFEKTTKKVMFISTTEPGVYSVLAEGVDGTKATSFIKFVREAK